MVNTFGSGTKRIWALVSVTVLYSQATHLQHLSTSRKSNGQDYQPIYRKLQKIEQFKEFSFRKIVHVQWLTRNVCGLVKKRGHQENDFFYFSVQCTILSMKEMHNLQSNITFNHLLSLFILLKLYNLVLSILSSVWVIKLNQMHPHKQA